MLLHEPEPAPQLLDLLPGGADPKLKGAILSFEHPDPLPGLEQLGASLPLPLALGQVLLRFEAALPPGGELFLEGVEKPLQLRERGLIRTRVRWCQASAPAG